MIRVSVIDAEKRCVTESTARPAALHDENNGNVPPGQRHHVRSLPRAAEDVRETLLTMT